MSITKKQSKKVPINKKLYLSLSLCFILALTSISCSKSKKTISIENKTEASTEIKNNTNQVKTSILPETSVSNDTNAANTTNESKKTTSSNSSTSTSKGTASSKSDSSSSSNIPSTTPSSSTTSTAPPPPPAPTPVSCVYGNTASNLVNGGFAAFSQNSIYYTNEGLCKANADGTNPTKISSTSGSCYNIIGDWIYYVNSFGDSGIFKIKKDGSSKTKICSDAPFFISVVNDWIYYQAPSNGYLNLYKIKTDGTSKTNLDFSLNNTLVNIDNPELIVEGNWVYLDLFNTSSKTHSLYRVAIDGSSVNRVINDSCHHFSINGSYIYYIKNDFKEIYRTNLDGSNPTSIYKTPSGDFGIYSINVSNGYIYFSSDNQASSEQYQGIYKIKIDGSNFTKLSSISTKHICIVSDWIYFNGFSNNKASLMKIKIDGTQVSTIN